MTIQNMKFIMKYNTILDTIGKTPVVNISHLYQKAIDKNIEIWIKLERLNPGGSIKDRIALAMILDAENKGLIKKGHTIIEPTSGNTGIGLALVGASKGYEVILVMPESMSVERRRIMQAYGAKLDLTPKTKGMKGAIDRANELLNNHSSAWMPRQFENDSNPKIHEKTTALEILSDFNNGIDYLITGVGTGGHLTGCARILKKEFKNLLVYPVEPFESAVISGNKSGSHMIQGIGAGFIPKNLDTSLIETPITIEKDEAYNYARTIALNAGILVGISTGASLAAINKHLEFAKEKSVILTFAYDTGERYLSINDLY